MEMNRSLYSNAIFFNSLIGLCGLFQTFFIFRMGSQIYMLPSFKEWFVTGSVVGLIGMGILIKYYRHHTKYSLIYSTAVISTVATAILHLIIFGILRTKEPSSLYIPVYLLTLAASMVYAVALVFSETGKKIWLRIYGICLFVVLATVFSMIVWLTVSGHFQSTPMTEAVNKWASLGGSLVPLLVVVHFVSELEHTRATVSPLTTKGIRFSIAALILVSVVIVAVRFGKEAFRGLAAIPASVTWIERSIAEPFTARLYVNEQGDTLRYRFMKPLDYDPKKEYPIVVSLHHGGTHGTDNVRQVNGSPAALLLSRMENRHKYPAFLFVPQCPQGASWGGTVFPSIEALVFEGLNAFEKEFNIDPSRRYVTGVSGGGYGSWHFISTRPEMFAAAIPVCGGASPRFASSAKQVPVWAFHGENDKNVPVGLSRDMINAMKEVGGDPRYTEFKDAGHDIWNRVKETPGLLDWMFAQTRK